MAAEERRVLIVADGDVDAASLVDAASRAALIIAADGGAAKALGAGVKPDLVIGDGDSLAPDVRARLSGSGVEVRDAAVDKDESDTELCLFAALDAGASHIAIVGAMGGARPEHGVANLLLLAHPRLDDVDVEILDGGSRYVRVGTADGSGHRRIEGTPGDWVSLLALAGAVDGVTTSGLRFALHGERITSGPARGLSNELTDTVATVATTRGRLLVIQTTREPRRDTGR